MTILIIAGHGAGDPGACCGSLQEAELTRDLAAKVCALLPGHTIQYPEQRNAFKDVTKGVLTASHLKAADQVVELHFNAVKAEPGDGRIKGVEAYVTTACTDTLLAAALCEGIAGLGFTNRGVKRKNFSVIHTARKAGVPAVLLEVCFLDDGDDMGLYDPDAAAAAIAGVLADAFDLWADPAWDWAVSRGLLTEPDRNRAMTGAELAEALYILHGGAA